jgi:molecular chaperone HscB
MQNHFDLFHLPQRFALDGAALDSAYRDVQGQVHPDRFAQAGDAEKRVAMQWATRANEAYQTLKSPLKRAAYLCELNGVDLNIGSNTSMPSDFLMQQMEWHETLQEVRKNKNVTSLEDLNSEWRKARNELIKKIEASLDVKDFVLAAQDVRQLTFIEKFGEELRGAFESIENNE